MSSKTRQACFLYCRFGNFRENFIFANSSKGDISDVKNSRVRQGLPISINDRVILPFRENTVVAKHFRIYSVIAFICESRYGTYVIVSFDHIIYMLA